MTLEVIHRMLCVKGQKDCLKNLKEFFYNKAVNHSGSFDNNPWNQGGMYSQHPFNDILHENLCLSFR